MIFARCRVKLRLVSGATGALRRCIFQPRRPPTAERHSPDAGVNTPAPLAVPGGDAADTDMELFQPIARQPTDDVVAACQRLFLDSGRVQDLLRCPPAVETQYADQQPGAAAVDRAAAGTGERRAAAGVVRGALHPQQRPYPARLWLFRGEAAALPRVTPRRPGAMAVICSRWACRWPSPACR